VQQTLEQENIGYKSIETTDEQILVRVDSNDVQLRAREAIDQALSAISEDYFVAINLAPATPKWLESLGGTPMKLGLDLRGGVHFLMEVDMQAAIDKSMEDLIADFRTSLREERIRFRGVKQVGDHLEIRFRDQDTLDQAEFFLKQRQQGVEFSDRSLTLQAKLSDVRLIEIRDGAIKQNIQIIRNRVNQLGVAEPLVQRQGQDRIVVQLPGIQDSAKAKEILNATATLEFRLLDLEHDVRDALNGRVPSGSQLIEDENGAPRLLQKDVMVTGNHIINANAGADQYGLPQVSIKLDAKGGTKMSRGTKDNIGKPMATVFIEYKPDGEDAEGRTIFKKIEKVINVATIQAHLGRDFQITGIDSPARAQNLALLLRAGALIAPIQIVEESTIGPSLGKENINLGMQAIFWGFALVLGFMLFYYKAFGIVANVALAVNLILIVGVMSMIPGATLTLPGMAGIVLTVGMAVDANVLIFERIREEMREGRSVQQSIHFGYDSAFSTILDANITTLIAALILFAIGTGPVKGFSITLAIGILTSMFTAIVVTRAIVNSVWGGKKVKKLYI
jgi:preprotein translocase subunit SecD